MNKSKIQKFAVDGHKLLYKQIAQRAYQYGIEEGNVGKADATEVRGRILSPLEKSQRAALIAEINANGKRANSCICIVGVFNKLRQCSYFIGNKGLAKLVN